MGKRQFNKRVHSIWTDFHNIWLRVAIARRLLDSFLRFEILSELARSWRGLVGYEDQPLK